MEDTHQKEKHKLGGNNLSKNEIIKTWISGQHSCTLIIPKEIALKYGLDEPSHVVVECTEGGIFIRKIHEYK